MIHSSIAPREMHGRTDAAPAAQPIALVSGISEVYVNVIDFSTRARLRTKLVFTAISEIIYVNDVICGIYNI